MSTSSFVEDVIAEVGKREILWNKWHDDYCSRHLSDKAWVEASKALGKEKDEVKSKWRNLRDQFQRELRRVKILPSGELGPYTGKWCYFDHLFFLKDLMLPRVLRKIETRTKHMEECDENDGNSGELRFQIKEDPSSPAFEQASYDEEQEFATGDLRSSDAVDIPEITLSNHHPKRFKRKSAHIAFDNPMQVKYEEFQTDVDDDMCFVKSLVPFLRKLKPMRKLVVRNGIQSLLIRELLCERCRSEGQQPQCSCTS